MTRVQEALRGIREELKNGSTEFSWGEGLDAVGGDAVAVCERLRVSEGEEGVRLLEAHFVGEKSREIARLEDEKEKLAGENASLADEKEKLADENASLADENAALRDEIAALKRGEN